MRKTLKLLLLACIPFISTWAWAQTPTATLAWGAPVDYTSGQPISGTITYNIYQGTQTTPSTPTLTKVQSGVTSTGATVTAGLTPGTTQCFAVTAVVAGVESAQSLQACKAIPLPTPGVPTTLTVTVQ